MMCRAVRRLLAGAIVSLFAAACVQAADITAFEGARLIVGDGRAPIEKATLIIEDARIVQAGAAADVRVPPQAKRVNLTGKTIMPAIIDTHVHMNQSRDALVRDLQHLAYFGVGTVMSLGVDTTEEPFRIRAEPVPGAARLRTAGRGITAPEPGRETAPYWVTTEAEARRAVQENAAKKVDIIKVWVDDRNGKVVKLSPELYGAAIDEAHRHGLKVTAHIVKLDDAKGLLRAGIDAFAHSVRDRDVDDEFMTLLQQHPLFALNPNLTYRGVPANLDWLRGIVPAPRFEKLTSRNVVQPQAQELFAIQARNLVRMKQAGVRIVLGTDTSFDFPDGDAPWAVHIEMEDMVAAGMTPMEVLTAATRNAAELLGLSDAGTLQSGRSADFLVLDGNPVDDISNTRRIAAVYLRGKAVDRGGYR
jgi:imidazolonepropionase-like amidohydrolase